jgi:hypothetical protein
LLSIADANERDHASISILVGTKAHKLQLTPIDERSQTKCASANL